MLPQDKRKQAISLRLRVSDIRRIKRLAERIGVHDSDIIRYALKTMLARLSPLCDPGVRGRSLVPVFIDSGVDLLQHFSLDSERLDDIINSDAPSQERVEPEDIQLMALMGLQRSYAKLSLRQLQEQIQAAPASDSGLDDTLTSSFRRHLYQKYVNGESGDGEPAAKEARPADPASHPAGGRAARARAGQPPRAVQKKSAS